LDKVFTNLNYIVSMMLFAIGFFAIIMQPNLLRKLIGLNMMEASVFLFLVSVGYIQGGVAPIPGDNADIIMVNPIPQALILTGIVVSVSTTALALALSVKLYQHYGTLNVAEFRDAGK
jgi:multicomponent Na+:H+ antiporter subunit C